MNNSTQVEMTNLIEPRDATVNPTSNINTVVTPSSVSTQDPGNVDVIIVDPKSRVQQRGSQAAPRRNPTTVQGPNSAQMVDAEEEEEEVVLKYGASHVVKLFVPVTICLVFVIISLSLVTSYQDGGGATL